MADKTEQIWNEFSARLRAFIRRSVSDSVTADDLLQDIFLKIHSSIDSLRDETRIRSWVYQIARNVIIDHYRSRSNETVLPDGIPARENRDEETAEDEIAAGLRAMAEDLPEKYRDALILSEFESVPQNELAARKNISVSGMKSRVQRGRQMIKDSLMRCCHFEFDRYGTIIDMYPASCCCCCPGCGDKKNGDDGRLLIRR
ncbi:MAG TPA: RNA polymerase sigma factor SigZ [Spirochaetota bacterium]|nr:RNA polymerase sigma factor SigZ [Spirochaetota bacterium]